MRVRLSHHKIPAPVRVGVLAQRRGRHHVPVVGVHARRLANLKVRDLRRQPRRHHFVHGPAGLGEFAGEGQVCFLRGAPGRGFAGLGFGQAARGAQRDRAGHEAHEVVHFGGEGAGEARGPLRQDGQVRARAVRQEVFAHAVEGLRPH